MSGWEMRGLNHKGLVKRMRGAPAFIRSEYGPEFTAIAVRGWIGGVGTKTASIEPGSPWKNGHVGFLNGKLRDELLNARASTRLRRHGC